MKFFRSTYSLFAVIVILILGLFFTSSSALAGNPHQGWNPCEKYTPADIREQWSGDTAAPADLVLCVQGCQIMYESRSIDDISDEELWACTSGEPTELSVITPETGSADTDCQGLAPDDLQGYYVDQRILACRLHCIPNFDDMPSDEALRTCIEEHSRQEPAPNPEPTSDPFFDPNPYPVPVPITIDSETLSILQSILSSPIAPITGAVAGGLVAWVISMLGGGRTVLPPVPRPPTGGVRPGQAGPDGKIWSPTGQGWVSKSIYDYQQKWLQKGWRWNSQTGQFEGQHGAVNENGLVQDDELGWVDQNTFNDNEQKRAQGYVYNRSMGWQTPEDSNRFKSDWDGMRQRERKRSVDKNAQIQSELKESQAQRDQAFQQQMQKLDAGRIAEIKANFEMYQKRAQKYVNWDKNLEYAAYVAQTVETAADVGVAVCARLTGPAGKVIASAYETVKEVASTTDDVLASDDVVGKAKELGDDKIKDEYKDKIKEKIEEKVTPYIPKFVNRIANQIKRPIKRFILRKTGKTGLIIYQESEKKLLEYGKEKVEEFVEGQVESAVEEINSAFDPTLLTGV